MIDQTCQKWFVNFWAGDFLLENAPQSSRPIEVGGDQIGSLTENNQHSTMQEIADILKIIKSVKLLVKMKYVFYFMNILADPIYQGSSDCSSSHLMKHTIVVYFRSKITQSHYVYIRGYG